MYTYVLMHVIAISKKRGHGCESMEGSIWTGLEGKKGTEKCCNYSIKIKLKAKHDSKFRWKHKFQIKVAQRTCIYSSMDLRKWIARSFTYLPSMSYYRNIEVITETSTRSMRIIKGLNHCLDIFVYKSRQPLQSGSNLSLHICTEKMGKPDRTPEVCENLCPDCNYQEKDAGF